MQLSLRTRLVVSFVAVALLVLLVFGFTAYRIALDADLDKEASMLQYFVEHEAEQLREEAARQPPSADPDFLSLDRNNPDRLLIIVDANGRYLGSRPLKRFFGPAYKQFEIQKLLAATTTSGVLSSGGEQFLWAASALPTSPYKLFAVSRRSSDSYAFARIFGMRLIITGAIIIWFAVWGALILAAAISRRLEEQNDALTYQALHDDLTGLPNRALLYRCVNKVLESAAQNKKSAALVVMDLNRFREANDTLGHSSGDLLLKQVGKRMGQILRDTDTVARLGGDEFALLLPGVAIESALQFANRICKALEQPFVIDDMRLDVEASLGIAVYPNHGKDAESLIRRADIAMYQAKKNAQGISVYNPNFDPHSVRRLIVMGKLRHAIDHNQDLNLFFQPKANLNKHSTSSVEALLRWVDPELGPISPGEFVLMAEQTGLIKPLTLWVLNAALRQCNEWRHQGVFLNVAVNLSARNLQDEKLGKQIRQLLDAWNIPPSCLILEITESAVMEDPQRALDILKDLNKLGIRISIDDFGTGYSSMGLLSRLPVYEVKIDRTFVMNMLSNKKDAAIVQSVIDLGHNLGYIVTAEGVEDRGTLKRLMDLGCDRIQGYFLCRPVSPGQLVEWLAKSKWGQRPAPNVVLLDRSS